MHGKPLRLLPYQAIVVLCGLLLTAWQPGQTTHLVANDTASRSLVAPGCTNQVATAPSLPGEQPAVVSVPGSPFGVVVAPGGQFAIASVNGSSGSGLAVLALSHGSPSLVRTFPLPALAAELTISHNGRYLLVAQAAYSTLLSLPELLNGSPNPVLGTFNDGAQRAVEGAFSADDSYVFVSDENATSPAVSVFNLREALSSGFSAPGVAVGRIPVGAFPGSLALSPSGHLLYVVSENTGIPGSPDYSQTSGLLQVIDVAVAEQDPSAALIAQAPAGCDPVRVQLSADGTLAWVTARGSDALLAFNTSRLLSDASSAIVADVLVGPEPVGVLLTDGGRDVLVANSFRSSTSNSPQTVSVVSASAALLGGTALLGTIPAGVFPRDFAYDPASRQVLLTNAGSGTVEEFPAPCPSVRSR